MDLSLECANSPRFNRSSRSSFRFHEKIQKEVLTTQPYEVLANIILNVDFDITIELWGYLHTSKDEAEKKILQ